MKIQLRGGTGGVVMVMTKTCKVEQARKDRERREKAIEQARVQREAMFDMEAESEAKAIRQHRAMVPARERKYENN